MQQIPLQAIPHQVFFVTLGTDLYQIQVKATNGVMSFSIGRNNQLIISNLRAVAGSLIIPSIYQESGNFIFQTANGALPDYTQFGITQYLFYYSDDELLAMRTPPTAIIKASYFNPNGALPLRFQPKGY